MKQPEQHIIPADVERTRLLDYVLKAIPAVMSRNHAKRLIKTGLLLIDGKKAETGWYVNPGQQIIINEAPEEPVKKIFNLPLKVIYEDDYLAVIYKPAGYSVSGNYFRTIENALPFNLTPSLKSDKMVNPRSVHRLDNQTSGLLLIAKTQRTRIDLGNQFERKQVTKGYQAIVIGKMPDYGIIDDPIEGKEAITEFKMLQLVNSNKYKHLSFVELMPQTGRTHQLRIHLSGMGHPILGDKLYTGSNLLYKGKGLLLSAVKLDFVHPITGFPMHFETVAPAKFLSLLQREQFMYETSIGMME